jgi:hypothetical protein
MGNISEAKSHVLYPVCMQSREIYGIFSKEREIIFRLETNYIFLDYFTLLFVGCKCFQGREPVM